MKIQFINNDGSGYSKIHEVSEGTTINAFLAETLPNSVDVQTSEEGHDVVSKTFEPSKYKIKVNGQIVASGYVLVDGDRVSASPKKIEGATAA